MAAAPLEKSAESDVSHDAAPARPVGRLEPRYLWLAAAALIVGISTGFALLQEPRPDPWAPVQTLSPDWWRYPVERNAFKRLPVVSAKLRAVHAHSDGKRLWAVGEAGLIVHSADGGRSWRRQSWAPATQQAGAQSTTPQQPAAFVPIGIDLRQVQERLVPSVSLPSAR